MHLERVTMVTTMRGSTSAPPSHAVASMAFRSVRQREEDFSEYVVSILPFVFLSSARANAAIWGQLAIAYPVVHQLDEKMDSRLRANDTWRHSATEMRAAVSDTL